MNAVLSNTRLRAAAFALLFTLASTTYLPAGEPASGPPNKNSQTVSALLAPVLKRANDAYRQRDYALTLKELDAADAMQPKNYMDQVVINKLRSAAQAQLAKAQQ